MGFFRIAKTFEVEYGHRLSKHPEKCRFPHGHSLRIEVVARGRELNDQDMVCDYKALKMIVTDVVERLDHAMALNSSDPQLEGLAAIGRGSAQTQATTSIPMTGAGPIKKGPLLIGVGQCDFIA